MEKQYNNILVLGGTGHYGKHMVNSLVQLSCRVRLLTRNKTKAAELFGTGIEYMEGDILDESIHDSLLEGIDAVLVSISAFKPKLIKDYIRIEKDTVIAFLQKAIEKGIQRVVYISVFDISPEAEKKLKLESASIKASVERFLKTTSINWTVLGAPPSYDLFLSLFRKGKLITPPYVPAVMPSICAEDVGVITARVIVRDNLARERIRLIGPEVLSYPIVAKKLSLITGKTVKQRKIPAIVPFLAYWITLVLSPLSYKILYINKVIKFIRLLRTFPKDMLERVTSAQEYIRTILGYEGKTFDEYAKNKLAEKA